jgi:hypothetical protein
VDSVSPQETKKKYYSLTPDDRNGSSFRNSVYLNIPQIRENVRSRDSSVGIATDYVLDGRDLIPGRGKRFLSIPQCPEPDLGATLPRIQWVPGALSPGVKRHGCEADHSPRSSAEVKNVGYILQLPPYVFMA